MTLTLTLCQCTACAHSAPPVEGASGMRLFNVQLS